MEQTESARSTDYVSLVLANWRKVATATLICTVAALILVLTLPRSYESTVTLVVYPPIFKETEPPQREGALQERQSRESLAAMMPLTFPVEAYRTMATSKDLVREVIDALQLAEDLGVEDLSRNLSVELIPLGSRSPSRGTLYSQMILFHARADRPQLAAQIAQKWAELFKLRVDGLAWSGMEETYNLIRAMWENTKEELEEAEDQLEAFRNQWDLNLLNKEKESKDGLLNVLESQLDTTDIDIAARAGELAALQQELGQEQKMDVLVKAPPDDAYWVLKKSDSDTGEATIDAEDVLRTEEYNPVYTFTRNKVVETQLLLQGLQKQRKELVLKTKELRAEISQLQKDLAEQEVVEKRLNRDVTTFEGTYELVASSLEKGKIAMTNRTSDIQVTGGAVEPEQPAGMRRLFKVAAAAFVGVFIGIGYIIAEFFLRNSASVAPS